MTWENLRWFLIALCAASALFAIANAARAQFVPQHTCDTLPALPGITAQERERWCVGLVSFQYPYYAFTADGSQLPASNAEFCRTCHHLPTGGDGHTGEQANYWLRHPGERDAVQLHTNLEDPQGFGPVEMEEQGEGFLSVRKALPLHMLGILDALDYRVFMEHHDPRDLDGDGISGRITWIEGDLGIRPGRFGWENQHSSLRDFVASAFDRELGFTEAEMLAAGPIFQREHPCSDDPVGCTADGIRFLGSSGPPPKRPGFSQGAFDRGEQVFHESGCAKCHVPDFGGIEGWYSDEALHDMGLSRCDRLRVPGSKAGYCEWSTPSLHQLRAHQPFLHDGAGFNSYHIAVLIGHPSDGEGGSARAAYIALPEADKRALWMFLDHL